MFEEATSIADGPDVENGPYTLHAGGGGDSEDDLTHKSEGKLSNAFSSTCVRPPNRDNTSKIR